jgi:hypothetical protein
LQPGLWHKKSALHFGGPEPYTDEHSRQQLMLGIGNDSAQRDCAGGGIDAHIEEV